MAMLRDALIRFSLPVWCRTSSPSIWHGPIAAQRRAAGGLRDFRAACRARCGGDFAALAAAERERFVREVDAEARRAGESHPFHLLRELAHRAYFSSEVGMTRALRYVRVPGRWEGCVPLQPGQPAWG